MPFEDQDYKDTSAGFGRLITWVLIAVLSLIIILAYLTTESCKSSKHMESIVSMQPHLPVDSSTRALHVEKKFRIGWWIQVDRSRTETIGDTAKKK